MDREGRRWPAFGRRPGRGVAAAFSKSRSNWTLTAARSANRGTRTMPPASPGRTMRPALARNVNLALLPTELTQFESPHFVDICRGKQHTTLLSGGLPYHRRLGRESSIRCWLFKARWPGRSGWDRHRRAASAGRRARIPHAAAVLPDQPPPPRPRGWLFHLDCRNVLATRWEALPAPQMSGVPTAHSPRRPKEPAFAFGYWRRTGGGVRWAALFSPRGVGPQNQPGRRAARGPGRGRRSHQHPHRPAPGDRSRRAVCVGMKPQPDIGPLSPWERARVRAVRKKTVKLFRQPSCCPSPPSPSPKRRGEKRHHGLRFSTDFAARPGHRSSAAGAAASGFSAIGDTGMTRRRNVNRCRTMRPGWQKPFPSRPGGR